jgi:hypothetical protein
VVDVSGLRTAPLVTMVGIGREGNGWDDYTLGIVITAKLSLTT